MIEQALYRIRGSENLEVLAQSAGIKDHWLARIQEICLGFGESPPGVACPGSLFALQLDKRNVAIVRGQDDVTSGVPSGLLFHFLILPKQLYQFLGGDPFWIAEYFPPAWEERQLPVLQWGGSAAPPWRTAAELQQILDVPYSSTLLGAAQALVDGGKIVFERGQPEPRLVRNLWTLLPISTRCEIWPSTFAFSNQNRFDIAVVPRASEIEFPGYLVEAAAGDYPEGRYELALQIAIEHADQDEIDKLFLRRSRGQTLHLASYLLGIFLLAGLIGLALQWTTQGVPRPKPNQPRAEEFFVAEPDQPLDREERQLLRKDLVTLCRRYRVSPPGDASELQILLALEGLDRKLQTLETRPSAINPGQVQQASNLFLGLALNNALGNSVLITFGPTGLLRDQGSLKRSLRYLLCKRGVASYNKPGLTGSQLIQDLETKLLQR